MAPHALYELGSALANLGQTQEACVTLSEIGVRFPNSPMVAQAGQRRQTIGCS